MQFFTFSLWYKTSEKEKYELTLALTQYYRLIFKSAFATALKR